MYFERMDQYARIGQVVNYWWEQLYHDPIFNPGWDRTRIGTGTRIPTFTIYYYHDGGFYRQHASPKKYVEAMSDSIVDAFAENVFRLSNLSNPTFVKDLRGYICELKNTEFSRHTAALSALSDFLINPKCPKLSKCLLSHLTELLHILNHIHLRDFLYMKQLGNPDWKNHLFRHSSKGLHNHSTINAYKFRFEYRTENEYTYTKSRRKPVLKKPKWEDVKFTAIESLSFAFFDLLERSLLFPDGPYTVYIYPLWDEVGYIGNAGLVYCGKKSNIIRHIEPLDKLYYLVHMLDTRIIPDIRSALETEAMVKLWSGVDRVALHKGTDAADEIQNVLQYIQDVGEVNYTARDEKFQVEYRDTCNPLAVDRGLNVISGITDDSVQVCSHKTDRATSGFLHSAAFGTSPCISYRRNSDHVAEHVPQSWITCDTGSHSGTYQRQR